MYGYHGTRSAGTAEFVRTRGGLLYYHEDRLGSVVAITDRHGEPILRYAYEAYGRPRAGVFGPYVFRRAKFPAWEFHVITNRCVPQTSSSGTHLRRIWLPSAIIVMTDSSPPPQLNRRPAGLRSPARAAASFQIRVLSRGAKKRP